MTVFTVTSDGSKGAGTLTYAVSHALSGDTIVFASTLTGTTGNTIDLPSTLDITQTNLTIIDTADNVTLSGEGTHTVIEVGIGASVSIDDLTIANGVGAGAASSNPSVVGGAAAGGIYDEGSLTLSNDVFSGNVATGGVGANAPTNGEGIGGGAGGAAAGGIYVASGASLDINTNVSFVADKATGGKGGFGGNGTYYGGGSEYVSGAGTGAYAYKGSGAGGAGGYAKSGRFAKYAQSNAKYQGYSEGHQGAAGAGQYGATGGNSGKQGGSESYLYNGILVNASGGGGGGGAAYADFGGAGTITCYLAGTSIMTDHGPVAVEDLRIGDRLPTASGEIMPIKWIGRRAYAGWAAEGNDYIQPIQFKAGSIADNVPSRDLFVSPEHAMLIGGSLIPARHLVNGISIVKAAPMEEVSYFHVEMERHTAVFAEGALSETFVDDDSRDRFNNAYEFHALYPEAPLVTVAEYCAPRVEDGFELETIRRSLMSRAVRLLPDGTAASAPQLSGNLDAVTRNVVEGWAYLPSSSGERVSLAIIDNGVTIGRVVADRYRADLEKAGIGDGRHAFSFLVPSGFSENVRHEIEVRRESDWSLLAGSPTVLAAVEFSLVTASMANAGAGAAVMLA